MAIIRALSGAAIRNDKNQVACRTDRHTSFKARAARLAGRQHVLTTTSLLAFSATCLACAMPDPQMLGRRICSPPHRLNPVPAAPYLDYEHTVFM